MALLPTNKDRKNIGVEDISIKDDINVDLGKREYSSKERKPIQLDPPVLKIIRDISYVKDTPMYEIVRLAVEAYLETLDDEEKAMYIRRTVG